ncbi:MAG: hypothetical protein ACC707_08460 [Thiohalomonadales bacterium]
MNSARLLPPLTRATQVAALGLEKRVYSSLALFFRSACKESYHLVSVESADISIIDMDGYKASHVLEQHKIDYPTRPVILTSINIISSSKGLFIQKPIKVSSLTNALQRAEQQVLSTKSAVSNSLLTDSRKNRSVANTKVKSEVRSKENSEPRKENKIHQPVRVAEVESSSKVVPDEPPVLENNIKIKRPRPVIAKVNARVKEPQLWSARSLDSLVSVSNSGFHLMSDELKNDAITARLLRQLQYNPQGMLQGYFKKAYDTALASRCNVRLEGPWRPITILINKHTVLVESNFRHVFALSAMNFRPEEVSITILPKDESDSVYDGEITQSIEQFVWKLCLRTSRGKVPIGTDLNVPILLKQWPNFTRTTVTPHALRIAALWAQRPTSLIKTAKILNISLSYVFVFYSSALPLNLLSHMNGEKVHKTTSLEPKQHTYRKLFNSLIEKLKSKTIST